MTLGGVYLGDSEMKQETNKRRAWCGRICALPLQVCVLVCLLLLGVLIRERYLTPTQTNLGLNLVGIAIGLVLALSIDRWRKRESEGHH